MSSWAWISGEDNTADWLTRDRLPDHLGEDSHWWNGPPILYKPIEELGLKYGIQRNDVLLGEKKIRYSSTTMMSTRLIDYKRYSDVNKIIWIVARILSIARRKSFKGGNISEISPQLLVEAENLLVKDAQKDLKIEVEKTDRKGRQGGRYASLIPASDENGHYVIGRRLIDKNPMTPDASLQKLMQTRHPLTRLFMNELTKRLDIEVGTSLLLIFDRNTGLPW